MTRSRAGGQSLVEFAMVGPVFLVLCVGLLQFGVWFWSANVAQEAARAAATTASGTYLAQYESGTWRLARGVADDPAAWAAAELAGVQRGQAVLSVAPTPGQPGPLIWLTLHEEAPASDHTERRDIEATVAIWMPSLGLGFLSQLPGLDPYITRVDVRTNRFYSE
jgi:hypothetical protein